MSAIFGIINFDGRPVEETDLELMADTLVHRGPDTSDIWIKGAIGLGSRIFHSTLESFSEVLPYSDSETGLVIVADARIDNRSELGGSLGLIKQVKSGIPDSLLILNAYKKWADDCVDYLIGDFAFAIWDDHRKRLFCARDHMGIRPFIHYVSQDEFVFASEDKAVRKAPRVPTNINEERICDYLVNELEGIDKTSTFFKDIYRLPPAHTLVATNNRIVKRCYWKPDPNNKIVLNSEEEYSEAFNELFTDAVKTRLRGNDVASMLSGGMDSSSIVGVAKQIHHENTGSAFPVFSAVSPFDSNCRETQFINLMISSGNLQSHKITTDDLIDLRDDINTIINNSQEPFDPMIMIITIYLKAKDSGYRVMLDGIDGDAITSLPLSAPSYLLNEGKWKAAIKMLLNQSQHLYLGKFHTFPMICESFSSAITPEFVRNIKSKYRNSFPKPVDFDQLVINPEFARICRLEQRLAKLRSYRQRITGKNTLRKLHINQILHPYSVVGLERYHRIASLCGIEPRHPFLDKRLVEYFIGIPWHQKAKDGWNKYLLRKSSEKFIPTAVCWREGAMNHLGWSFEKRWYEINRRDYSNIISNHTDLLQKYIELRKLLTSHETGAVNNKNIEDFLLGYILNRWLMNH